MAFLSSASTDHEVHWSVYERKAFAAVQAFRKLSYLLACNSTTRVFAKSPQSCLCFQSAAIELSLGRHGVLKAVRWALYLSAFIRRIEYVSGFSKTWPDIMQRWMRCYRKVPAIRSTASAVLFVDVTQSRKDASFRRPHIRKICSVQNKCKTEAPSDMVPSFFQVATR